MYEFRYSVSNSCFANKAVQNVNKSFVYITNCNPSSNILLRPKCLSTTALT